MNLGQIENKSTEQKNIFSFPFQRSTNRQERLLSTPTHINLSSQPILNNKNHYNQLSKQTLLLLSVPETSEEKEFSGFFLYQRNI